MLNLRSLAALAIVIPVALGCATRGELRRAIAEQRELIDQERAERIAADDMLRTDIDWLRNEIANLRTEFGARITAVEEGIQFIFPVHFAFDDATVRSEDTAALERFARVAQQYYAGSRVTVEGFADPAGSQAYNLRLSQRRAENVRQYIVSQGLTDDLVRAVGYGKSRLVYPDAWGDQPGGLENRRVVFVIETRGQARDVVAQMGDQI